MGVTRKGERSPELRLATSLARYERFRRIVELQAQLGAADQRLMWLLADREPRTLREIAEVLGLEQSTVNRQVNAALRAGLLERSKEPGLPAALFHATESGLARFQQDLDVAFGAFGAGLAAMEPEERPRFLRLLDAFVDGFGDAVRDDADPASGA